MKDGSRLMRRAAALLAGGAIALGIGGPHAVESAHGGSLPTSAEIVAVCPDGHPSRHFDAPDLIEVRPCPACVLACVGLGEAAARPPALSAPLPQQAVVAAVPAAGVRPPADSRRPRGPPVLTPSS